MRPSTCSCVYLVPICANYPICGCCTSELRSPSSHASICSHAHIAGVGYLILQAEGSFDINTVMAGILVLTAFALALDGLVGRIERRLMTWQPKAGESEKL